MLLELTQATISRIPHFLAQTKIGGVWLYFGLILLGGMTCIYMLHLKYKTHLLHLITEMERKERAIADLEAKEAYVTEELEDLRKAEAILILRNGNLESLIAQHLKRGDQTKRISL